MILNEIIEQTTFFERNTESIVTGIVTSLVFLLALSRLKPNLKICDKISEELMDGVPHFGIKVINKSWFFKVYDLKVRLQSVRVVPSENNEDFHMDDIVLRKNHTWFLNKFNIRHSFQDYIFNRKRLKTRTDYCVQFFTKEDLNILVESNKRIKFEVLAKHSLSGFSVVKNYTFRHKNDLVKGSFLSGNTALINE